MGAYVAYKITEFIVMAIVYLFIFLIKVIIWTFPWSLVVLGVGAAGVLIAVNASHFVGASTSGSAQTIQSAPARPAASASPSRVPTSGPTAAAASRAQAAAAPAAPTPTAVRALVVANTDGQGAYLRRTPRMNDRLVAWPDGTILQPTGQTAGGDGHAWHQVRDPKGNVGWVPDDYLRESR
jgi:hypothetical protein